MSLPGADTAGVSGQDDNEKPAVGESSSSLSMSSEKNDPGSTSRRGFRRLRLRRRGRSNSTRSMQSLNHTMPFWHPPSGYSVPPPSVRLRSSMTVTSLDDSLSRRGLSRSRRRAQVTSNGDGDAQQPSPGEEDQDEDFSVSFGKVQIRKYERIPGDNPSICFGVPLAIGWAYNEEGEPVSVEEYESKRSPEPKKRDELYVSLRERERILTDDWGISRSAVRAAERSVALASQQRRATASTLHLEPAQEAIESVRKKFDRVVKGKSSKKEEERMWREAQERTTSISQPAQNGSSSRPSPANTATCIVATEPDDDTVEIVRISPRARGDLMFDNRCASGRNLNYRQGSFVAK